MNIRRGIALLLASTGFWSGAAHAQELEFGPLLGVEIPFDMNRGRNVGVLERKRPELDALGIRVGSFLVLPSLDVGAGYTSNVYGSLSDKKSDAFFTIDPIVSVQSQWSRNALGLTAQGALKRFASQTPKNEDGYSVAANGRLDVVGDDTIEAYLQQEKGYEAQYSGSFPANAAQSVEFDRTTGILRGTFDLNRVRLVGSADFNLLNYHDTAALSGRVLDQDFRDRNVARGSVRAEYALSPDTAAFVQGTYLDSNYTNKNLPGGNRSSTEARILGGFTFDLSTLVRASIGVGFVHRHYQSAVYPDISDVAADIRVDYFLNELTTVSLAVRRDIEDAIVARSPGYVATHAQLRVDHELLRNLLPFIEGEYEHDEFKDITRRDDLYHIRGGASYMANRMLTFAPEMSYIKRKSAGAPIGQEFNEFQTLLRVILKR